MTLFVSGFLTCLAMVIGLVIVLALFTASGINQDGDEDENDPDHMVSPDIPKDAVPRTKTFAFFVGTLNPLGCRVDLHRRVEDVVKGVDPGSYLIGLTEPPPEKLSVVIEILGALGADLTATGDAQGDLIMVHLRRLDGSPYLNGPVSVRVHMFTGMPVIYPTPCH